MLLSLFVPMTPKAQISDRGDALWKNFEAIGSRARRVRHLSLVVAVDSPTDISLSGNATRGKQITVGSVEEFSRVVSTLAGPGTAVVGFGPSQKGAVLSPTPE